MTKTVSKMKREDGVEDEEDRGVRTRWKKTVTCMLKEDGGMDKGEDGACRLEKNAQGLGLCSIG